MNSKPTKRMIVLLVLLVAAWLLWSGLYKPLLLGLGIFSCAITIYFVRRLGYFESDAYEQPIGLRILGYWAWLAKEIVKSSLQVARIIIDPRLPVSPKVVTITVDSEHPVDPALLANSITLTPGTLSVDVWKGKIIVHALTEAGADELQKGEMNRRVAALRKA